MILNVSQRSVTQSEQAMPDGYAGLEQTVSGFGHRPAKTIQLAEAIEIRAAESSVRQVEVF